MGKDYGVVLNMDTVVWFDSPTAIANVAVTSRFGPSHKAFLIVPMVGRWLYRLNQRCAIKSFIAVVNMLA